MVVSWKMQDVIVRAQNMKHGLAQACDHIFFAFGFASRCVHQDDSFAAWLIAYKFYFNAASLTENWVSVRNVTQISARVFVYVLANRTCDIFGRNTLGCG